MTHGKPFASMRTAPVALAAGVLALAASPVRAQVTTVNISAQSNCDLSGDNGIDVPLAAGTYVMRPIAGTFTAWDAWGSVSGCDAGGGGCSTGWFIAWRVIHQDGVTDAFPNPFTGIWSTPELALSHTGPALLVVHKPETVTFAIFDTPCFDNLGGVSLEVTWCSADFNHDGTVNSTDVSDFINAWFEDQASGTLVTDWDHNGVVNSTDVSEFINSWFDNQAAGCG